MKTFHFTQFKTVLAVTLFLFVQSCTVAPGVRKNDQISAGKRDDFHKLNNEVLGYMKANDPKGLRMLFSKELNAENNARMIELISNHLNDNTYQLLDEYYLVHKTADVDTVPIKSGDINRYAIYYPNTAREMYLAYFIPKKPNNKQMVSLVYAKLNYGWKVVKFEISPYTINGKTAPELYALSRAQYGKGEIQAALNNVSLAMACFSPGTYWAYPDKDDAAQFYGKINEEVNKKYYSHDLVLNQIATGPMILRIYNQSKDDGTYPMIYYMTHFPLDDTVKVKNENLQVRKAVAQLMPGLDENNKYILYSAFNKQPTGYNTVEHFDMVEKVH